jgi:multicomponent Na+:H+ antiporter subunit D
MAPETDIRLLFAILAPLLGAGLVMVTGKKPNLREACSLLAACTLFGLTVAMCGEVLNGRTLHYTLFTLLPGLSFSLRADALSMIFAVAASFLWILAVFYSAGYMRGHHEPNQTRFNACFALALFGAMGCAFSDNLLTLYLFYEIVSISTYPLVAHHQDTEGYAGGRKYLVYLTTTAKALVLPAMVLVFVLVGNLDFAHSSASGILPAGTDRWLVIGLFFAFLFGFAKNGIMPFHSWLPAAMVAPTPVSALLHAVAVVKVGVFSTVRVMLHVFGTNPMHDYNLGLPTAYIVSFTILTASVIALSKDNLKARLAYSTVSQLSYIVLGVALLTPLGIQGGLFHIAGHAFAKITLFFCAGAIYVTAHKKNISELDGLGRQMPWTFAAFGLAALSMIGAPPVGGFVSKWSLLVGAVDAHAYIILAVLIASTLLNAAYFAPIIYRAYFGKPSAAAGHGHHGLSDHSHDEGHHDDHHHHGEAAPAMLVPLCLTAAISVALGFFPDVFLKLANAVLQ